MAQYNSELIRSLPIDVLAKLIQLALWVSESTNHGYEQIYRDDELIVFRKTPTSTEDTHAKD